MKLHRWLGQAKGLARRFTEKASKFQSNNGTIHPSAGIIVIGNEILKAQVKDTNSVHACSCLYKIGVNVKKISVISDNVYDIAREMQDFSTKYKYVITSGGIGPTHDDVTFEALAMAFEDELQYHPTLVDIIKNTFGYTDMSSPGFKMALVPSKAKLKFSIVKTTGRQISYPCVVLGNVHVFPGSPLFFKTSFDSLYEELFPRATEYHTAEIFINAYEESFANALTAIAKEYPHVSFGSYPEHSRYYKARVTVESNDKKETQRVVEKLKAVLPTEIVKDHDRFPHIDCLVKFEKLMTKLVYKDTFSTMLKYYRRPHRVAIYFDGSPESIILVHLARTAITKAGLTEPIRIASFHDDLKQESLIKFLHDLSERYNIKFISMPYEQNLHNVLRDLALESNDLKTLMVGSRKTNTSPTRGDQIAALNNVQYLDIVSPLSEWTKQDVDLILTRLSLPYFECNKKSD